MKTVKDIFPKGLIVSCQAREDEPLYGSDIMAKMAKAAELGGAVGIRANSPEDISAIRHAVDLPIIGIFKVKTEKFGLFITPDFDSANQIAVAGSDMIAIDATPRPRPGGENLSDLVKRIHKELDLPVMADCSTIEEAINAEKLGCDVAATTLAGYTSYSRKTEGPDMELLKEFIEKLEIPVFGEGRFYYPEQVSEALKAGAHAIVVGGAITAPQQVTERFVKNIK